MEESREIIENGRRIMEDSRRIIAKKNNGGK